MGGIGAHIVRRGVFSSRSHQNISTLTDAKSDYGGIVRHDRHKIVSKDCHHVLVDAEF